MTLKERIWRRDFIDKFRLGKRKKTAYQACAYLRILTRLHNPTIGASFLNLSLNAWRQGDAAFFQDIARILKRKAGKSSVEAHPAAYNLWLYFFKLPDEVLERQSEKVFSIVDIQNICGCDISERTAARLAREFGLKTRPKGAHGKAWQKFGN